MLVKVLGAIDILAALIFLSAALGAKASPEILIFFAVLLFIKGFVFSLMGDWLSIQDVFYSLLLLLLVIFNLPAWLLLVATFLLIAKGAFSYL